MFRASCLATVLAAVVAASSAAETSDPAAQGSFSRQHASITYSWDLGSLCADRDRVVEASTGSTIHFRICGDVAASCAPDSAPTVEHSVAARFWGGDRDGAPCHDATGATQPCPARACEVLGTRPTTSPAGGWEPIVEAGSVVGARLAAQPASADVPDQHWCVAPPARASRPFPASFYPNTRLRPHSDGEGAGASRGVDLEIRCDPSVPDLHVDSATKGRDCRHAVRMRSQAACPAAEGEETAEVGAGERVEAASGWALSNCPSSERNTIIQLSGECRTLQVPKRWNLTSLAAPEGYTRTLDYFVRRFRANASAPSPQGSLWLLGVEPGDSGGSMLPLVEQYTGHGWDVFLPDHRGTGLSNRLHCASDATQKTGTGTEVLAYELAPCLHEVLTKEPHGDLALFSTSMAAADMLHTARAERASADAPVKVIGLSYGALLALRVLQVEEEASVDDTITGMVLDSPWDPGLYSYMDQLQYPTASMATLMQACGADPRCAERVGGDPVQTLEAVLRALDNAPQPPAAGVPAESAHRRAATGAWFRCWNAGFDSALLRRAASLLPTATGSFAGLPALLRRLLRCAPEDVAVLQRVAGFVRSHDRESLSALFTAPRSGVTMINVALGESRVVDADEYFTNAELRDTPPASSLHPLMRAAAAGMWPTYSDPLSRNYPSSRPPLFLLAAGAFDGTAPQVAASRLYHRLEDGTTCAGGTHGCLAPEVLLYPSPHLLSFFSPVRKAVADCFVKFLKGVKTPKECLLQDHGLDPHVNFSTPAAADARVFGTTDVWGDSVASSALAPFPSGASAAAVDLSSVQAGVVVSAVVSCLTLAVLVALMLLRFHARRKPVAQDDLYANML